MPACTEPFDEAQHIGPTRALDPEMLLLQTDGAALIARALEDLPCRSRALIVHRDLEGLSYQELADVMDLPIGTVMSGLSRARTALRRAIGRRLAFPALARQVTVADAESVSGASAARCSAAARPGRQRTMA